MTREDFAKKIKWNLIIGFFGLLNAVASIPQLIKIISTKKSGDVSALMIILFGCIQIAYAFHGFFRRDRMLVIAMVMSLIVTISILLAISLTR